MLLIHIFNGQRSMVVTLKCTSKPRPIHYRWNLSIYNIHIKKTSILRTQLLVPGIKQLLYYSTSINGQFLRSPQVHYRGFTVFIWTDRIIHSIHMYNNCRKANKSEVEKKYHEKVRSIPPDLLRYTRPLQSLK